MPSLGNVSRTAFANLAPLRPICACLLCDIAGEGAGSLELKEDDSLHQLRRVVLHIADLGPDFPRFDRTGVGFISAAA